MSTGYPTTSVRRALDLDCHHIGLPGKEGANGAWDLGKDFRNRSRSPLGLVTIAGRDQGTAMSSTAEADPADQ
jgi:hypothetical protein